MCNTTKMVLRRKFLLQSAGNLNFNFIYTVERKHKIKENIYFFYIPEFERETSPKMT